jgi:hypothetical protein
MVNKVHMFSLICGIWIQKTDIYTYPNMIINDRYIDSSCKVPAIMRLSEGTRARGEKKRE